MSMAHVQRYPQSLDSIAIHLANMDLNETEAKRIKYVEQLRAHFKTEEPTIHISDDDNVLIAFLRTCKYNLQRTIAKLRNYYIMRGRLPEIFAQRDPMVARIQELLSLGFFVPLRKFNDNRIVVIARFGCFDPTEFSLTECLKVGYMIADVCSRICPQIQVHGVCCLADMQGIGIGHLRLFTPSIIRHMVNSCENYHCRPKQLVFFNAPTYCNVMLNMFRTLLSAKLKQRFRVHGNGKHSLVEIMDASILPKEYGGDDGSLEEHIQFWREEVTRHRDWLLYDEQFVAETNRK